MICTLTEGRGVAPADTLGGINWAGRRFESRCYVGRTPVRVTGRPTQTPVLCLKGVLSGMSFYGLLHLDHGERSAVNVKTADFDEQVRLYALCAVNLSNSLALQGKRFTLITNKAGAVRSALAHTPGELDMREIPFKTAVPRGVDFYSAHHKIDCFRYFSGLDSQYAALIDLDAICINPFPVSFDRNIARGIAMCYDISDQVIPAFGADRISADLEAIHGLHSEGRWYGGEFICGPPEFFGKLVETIETIYANYVENISSLHHVGDEAPVSAALEIMKLNGTQIADAGTLGIVARHWNGRPPFIPRPFEHMSQGTILHLPNDKLFLAKLGRSGKASKQAFFRAYDLRRRNYLRRKLKTVDTALRDVLRHIRTHYTNPLRDTLGLKRRRRLGR